MAIAKMLKLKLVGINAKQNELLDVLHSTGSVELTAPEKIEGYANVHTDGSEINRKKERVEKALSIIAEKCKVAKADGGEKDGFGITYEQFIQIKSREEEILGYADTAMKLSENISLYHAEALALKQEVAYYRPYRDMEDTFSSFKNTQKTLCRLGTVEKKAWLKLSERLSGINYLYFHLLSEDEKFVVLCVVFHESALEEVNSALGESAFARCTKDGDYTALEKINDLNEQIKEKYKSIKNATDSIVKSAEKVRDLKILCDYYLFEQEKLSAGNNFQKTKNVFYLEGYVPKECENKVNDALTAFEGHIYYEYQALTDEDYAPTLMKNKKGVSDFEFVTNLYSVPKYQELDPNAVMGFFFAVFLGFITADVGYGLLMIIGGLLFNARAKRKTGINKLAGVITMAGIPTVLFGLGFDSFFGIPILRNLGLIQNTLLPDPVSHTSMLAGISIPTLLLIALGMGVVHIMTSLCVLAWSNFRKGQILDGICDGLIWAVFLAGLMLFVLCEIGTVTGLNDVALYLLIGSVGLGAITAGRHAKGFGKFTKAFGAVYGLINYMSDILSYARLYGLMLSGAKIAEIFSQQLALPMLDSPGGVAGVIACAIIMLIGHLFNIAMGLLGAFIHDARLQYVEFFSHFYTGDGELFKPLGSSLKHVYIK